MYTEREFRYPSKNQYHDELTKIYHSKQTNLYHSYLSKYLKFRKIKETELPPNPFTKLKAIDNYKRLDGRSRRKSEKVSDDLTKQMRFLHVAVNNFRKNVHENNLKEMDQHRRLYGPKWLIYRDPISNVDQFNSFVEENELIRKKKNEIDNQNSSEPSIFDDTMMKNDQLSHFMELVDDKKKTKLQYLNDLKAVLFVDLVKKMHIDQIRTISKVIEKKNEEYCIKLNKYDESLRSHLEYSKEVCKKTAEAIKVDDDFAIERQEMKDMIKPKMIQVFELNQKFIKLEHTFNQYRAYKEFLFDVAGTFLPEKLRAHFTEEETKDKNCFLNLIKKRSSFSTQNVQITTEEVDKEIDQIERLLTHVFPDTTILVDILSDLEATNLSYIELAEDYKERCEKTTKDIEKFKSEIEARNITNKQNIDLEVEKRENCKRKLEEIDKLMENMDQFVNIEKLCEEFKIQFDTPGMNLTTVLAFMKERIQNVHNNIFGSFTSQMTTIDMLKNLEVLAVELIDCLAFLTPEEIKIAMNKTQEDRYRITRQLTREIELRAEEARRIKTMKKASQPPRYQTTRRIMYRSKAE